MFLREFIKEAPLRVTVDEGVPAWLINMVRIDTSSSQWRKTKKGSIRTKELLCVQHALNKLGYKAGKADGWFGKKTAKAVMAFQKDNDLTVDGDPGKNTIARMISIAKGKFPAAKELSKANIDQNFPRDKVPSDCTAMVKPADDDAKGKKQDDNLPRYQDKMQSVAAYKTVKGSGQGKRYTVYDQEGKEIATGRGSGPSDLPTKDEYEQKPKGPKQFKDTTEYYAWINAGKPSAEEWSKMWPPKDTKKAPQDIMQYLGKKTIKEVEALIVQAINQKDFKLALLIIDTDMRAEWISEENYKKLKGLAQKQTSPSKFEETFQKKSLDEKQVWAKKGKSIVRKYRCTAGIRKGRVVTSAAACFGAPDIKKRIMLKKTKARLGPRMTRKAKRTKRTNPLSRRVASLNKAAR